MLTEEKGKEYLKRMFGLDLDNPPEGPLCEDLDLSQFLEPIPGKEGKWNYEQTA